MTNTTNQLAQATGDCVVFTLSDVQRVIRSYNRCGDKLYIRAKKSRETGKFWSRPFILYTADEYFARCRSYVLRTVPTAR